MTILAVGCKKDDIDPDDNKNPGDTTTITNPNYTQVKGDWEWIDQGYLHIPSKYGVVYKAWPLHGGIYCYWKEDIGAQYIARVSYYDGATWTNVYQDVNADAEMDFAVHNGDLYHFASDVNGAYTLRYNNGVATYIDTANWARYDHSAYIASTGTDLIRIVTAYAQVQGYLTFETWNGTDWIVTDSAITIAGLPTGYAWTTDGTGKVYIMINESATDKFKIYSYAGAGTLKLAVNVSFGLVGYQPKIFEHNGVLHILLASTSGLPGRYYRTLITATTTINTVIDVPTIDSFLVEAYSTPQGIIYTRGTLTSNPLTTLNDIFLLPDGATKPKRFNINLDAASYAAVTAQGKGVGLVGERGIYDGAVYFYYNGQLHCIGNGHAGSQLGGAATQVYMARYNEQ